MVKLINNIVEMIIYNIVIYKLYVTKNWYNNSCPITIIIFYVCRKILYFWKPIGQVCLQHQIKNPAMDPSNSRNIEFQEDIEALRWIPDSIANSASDARGFLHSYQYIIMYGYGNLACCIHFNINLIIKFLFHFK